MEYNLKTQIILGREDLRLFMEEKGDNELLDKTELEAMGEISIPVCNKVWLTK